MPTAVDRLIGRLERLLKTDLRYLLSGGFWLMLGKAASMLSAFALSVAFANLFPKEAYGSYKYVLSVAGILATATLPGMGIAAISSSAQGRTKAVLSMLRERQRWSLFGIAAALGICVYYALNGNTPFAFAFGIVAAFLPFFDPFSLYDSLLQGKRDFRTSTLYSSVSQAAASAALIIVLFLTDSLLVALVTYFLSWTVLRLIFWKRTTLRYPLVGEDDPESVSYGRHLSFMSAFPVVVQYLDRILVFARVSPAALAAYSIATAMPEQIKSVFKNAQVLILPKLAERTPEESRRAVLRVMNPVHLVLAAATAAYVLAAPLLFRVFFPAYTEAIFLSQLYALSILTASTVLPLSALHARKARNALYGFNTVRSVVQLALLVWLTFSYGAAGAVASRVLSDGFNLVALTFILYRDDKQRA